jgi:hypothetical protein
MLQKRTLLQKSGALREWWLLLLAAAFKKITKTCNNFKPRASHARHAFARKNGTPPGRRFKPSLPCKSSRRIKKIALPENNRRASTRAILLF